MLKVLATDYHLMVLYACRHVHEDGHCNPDDTFVDILSRVQEFPGEAQSFALLLHVQRACFQPGEFVKNDLLGVYRIDPISLVDYL